MATSPTPLTFLVPTICLSGEPGLITTKVVDVAPAVANAFPRKPCVQTGVAVAEKFAADPELHSSNVIT
jgi:hypothetical protein